MNLGVLFPTPNKENTRYFHDNTKLHSRIHRILIMFHHTMFGNSTVEKLKVKDTTVTAGLLPSDFWNWTFSPLPLALSDLRRKLGSGVDDEKNGEVSKGAERRMRWMTFQQLKSWATSHSFMWSWSQRILERIFFCPVFHGRSWNSMASFATQTNTTRNNC